jgi:hypothetical protein
VPVRREGCWILSRLSDGTLQDLDGQARVDLARLRDELRAGRTFRVYQHETGAECTYQVLVQLLLDALPEVIGLSREGGDLAAVGRALWPDGIASLNGTRRPRGSE